MLAVTRGTRTMLDVCTPTGALPDGDAKIGQHDSSAGSLANHRPAARCKHVSRWPRCKQAVANGQHVAKEGHMSPSRRPPATGGGGQGQVSEISNMHPLVCMLACVTRLQPFLCTHPCTRVSPCTHPCTRVSTLSVHAPLPPCLTLTPSPMTSVGARIIAELRAQVAQAKSSEAKVQAALQALEAKTQAAAAAARTAEDRREEAEREAVHVRAQFEDGEARFRKLSQELVATQSDLKDLRVVVVVVAVVVVVVVCLRHPRRSSQAHCGALAAMCSCAAHKLRP